MGKARLLIAVLVVLMIFISCSGALYAKEGAGFSARVEMWMPTLSGSINPSGYTINLRDDLNLGKYNPMGLGVGYNFDPNHRVLVNYMHFNNEGSNILSKPFIYQGVTFNTGSRIDSVLKSSLIDGRYEWLLGRNDTGEFNLNAGLRSVSMSSKVSNIGGRAAEQNISLFEPIIGVS
ncbi:MAG: hypothetical protein M1269_07290, partial [Chloroflexi bacterium]|nr:hypothetical protein [Chloroflexota bacterium]